MDHQLHRPWATNYYYYSIIYTTIIILLYDYYYSTCSTQMHNKKSHIYVLLPSPAVSSIQPSPLLVSTGHGTSPKKGFLFVRGCLWNLTHGFSWLDNPRAEGVCPRPPRGFGLGPIRSVMSNIMAEEKLQADRAIQTCRCKRPELSVQKHRGMLYSDQSDY